MAKLFNFCCIGIPVLLGIIIAILNSDNAAVNEILVHKLLSRFETGVFCMQLVKQNNIIVAYGDLPNNIEQGSQIKDSKLCSNVIIVKDKDALYSGFLRGTIGIGETYFREEWTFDHNKYELGDIVSYMFWNVLNTAGPFTGYVAYFSVNEWKEYFHAIGVTKDESQDMQDVCYHYFDHRFYEKMLDDTMMYTCALWNKSTETLYDAQINKVEVLLHKLKLDDTVQNVLDVGCGWGFVPNYIKQNINKNINTTGITIATDQYEYAVKRYGNGGGDSPYYKLQDFRNLDEQYGPNYFDRIISIGVISHIHIKRLDEWFQTLYYVLKPGGYFVMQGIVGTTAFSNGNRAWQDRRYACTTNNFIYKYLFPGGCVLLSDWMHESAIKAGFIVMHRDFIGQHYSKTLQLWRENINKNEKYLLENNIVAKKKYLAYEMYLAQAEALYRTGKIEKTQFVFYKPKKDEIHKHKFGTYSDDIELSWQGFGY